MGKSADEVKNEIRETRSDMSETIDAIADRTSPRRVIRRRRERMSNGLRSARERVMGRAGDAYGTTAESAHRLTDGAEERVGAIADRARQAPEAVVQQTQGNPLAAGLIAFGGGLLLASLVPPSGPEQRLAGKVKEQAGPLQDELARAGHEVGDHLKSTAREGADQVKQRAGEAAGTVQEDVRSSAKELQQEARR